MNRRVSLVCLDVDGTLTDGVGGPALPGAADAMRRLRTAMPVRLVSNTTVSHEIARAIEAFGLTAQEVRDILIYGFKRSFFPGSYLEKRNYVRQVIDYANRVLAGK